ncbi:MAG TPA: hypothetical protein VFY83_06675 [Anaerolineales bacterium]|nr:hypothetical protein [Anaerolineales bacterium]
MMTIFMKNFWQAVVQLFGKSDGAEALTYPRCAYGRVPPEVNFKDTVLLTKRSKKFTH